jgi:hypothetical protein
MTHERGFVELDDLDEPRVNMLQAVLNHQFLDGLLDTVVDLLLDAGLLGEDISKQGQEKWDILSDELGEVHISQGTAHDHFLVSTWWLSSLGVTSSSEHREDVSETEIVVTLL